MRYFLIMLMSFLLLSCNKEKPERDYFIGVWKADDGAMIKFYGNGKCKASKLNYYNIHPFEKYRKRLLSFEGSWNFNSDKIHLSYSKEETYKYEGKVIDYKAGIDFHISGQGMFGCKPPWNLYLFIGDPDDMNKYGFVKQ